MVVMAAFDRQPVLHGDRLWVRPLEAEWPTRRLRSGRASRTSRYRWASAMWRRLQR